MTVIAGVLLTILAIGLILGAYAFFAPSRKKDEVPERVLYALEPEVVQQTEGTNPAEDEFSHLNESQRCDLVFSMGALDDDHSLGLLTRALDDKSEAVATAAAHALAQRGKVEAVREFVDAHPGDRAGKMLDALAILE